MSNDIKTDRTSPSPSLTQQPLIEKEAAPIVKERDLDSVTLRLSQNRPPTQSGRASILRDLEKLNREIFRFHESGTAGTFEDQDGGEATALPKELHGAAQKLATLREQSYALRPGSLKYEGDATLVSNKVVAIIGKASGLAQDAHLLNESRARQLLSS